MKAPDFAYARPASLDAALALLAEHGEDAVPLAGGQSLVTALNMRLSAPGLLVDLNAIPELTGVSEAGGEAGGIVRIGAMTRHRDVGTAALVRERLPGVKTTVIGSSVPATVKALAADDFVIAGYVPDVTPHFNGCRISISPLRYGAGVKGKINLAMSYGLPVVATTTSIEGMHLEHEADVIVADTPDAFADAIVRLYGDQALWERLAAAGRDNVRRHFSRDVAKAALRALFERAVRRA